MHGEDRLIECTFPNLTPMSSPLCLLAIVSQSLCDSSSLWRPNRLLLEGEGKVPGFTGWGRGARGPTRCYKTTVSTLGTSGAYLLSPILGAFWSLVVQNTWFLADTPLTVLSFRFLLSAKSVTIGHHLSTFTYLQLSPACPFILS